LRAKTVAQPIGLMNTTEPIGLIFPRSTEAQAKPIIQKQGHVGRQPLWENQREEQRKDRPVEYDGRQVLSIGLAANGRQ